ncbi:hypothetical protein [Microbaculum sp. FT89]|uniref:hypothetical protein n=1 Tax=Microbaculum sp. FT89 TaxID=3447298 RepID=UPI003F530A89
MIGAIPAIALGVIAISAVICAVSVVCIGLFYLERVLVALDVMNAQVAAMREILIDLDLDDRISATASDIASIEANTRRVSREIS